MKPQTRSPLAVPAHACKHVRCNAVPSLISFREGLWQFMQVLYFGHEGIRAAVGIASLRTNR